MNSLLERMIFKKSINMSPEALATLRTFDSPPVLVYGSSVHEAMLSPSFGVIYQNQPAVQTCVKFLARSVAQLNIKMFRRKGDDDREQLHDHPASKQLQRPNSYTTRYRMMFATIADLEIFDNAFWLKMRVGTQLALVRIPPDIVVIHGAQWVKPDSYTIVPGRMFGSDSVVEVPAADMIHFRGYNPLDQRMGVSPMIALQSILMEDWESRKYRRNFWSKAARMEGVIERPLDAPDWSDEARKRFRDDWTAATTGASNSGVTGIIEEGMQFKPYSFSPKDTEWIAGRKLTLAEVAHIMHIPPSMLGLESTGGPGTNSIVEEHKMLYQDTLGPTLEMIEEELVLSLLPEFDDIANVYFEFNLNDKLKGSFEEQATILTTATGGPWLTRKEARARMNLPDVGEDTDKLIVPMNVTIGGQPAPTVPTATPATPIPANDQANPPVPPKTRDHAQFMRTKRDDFVDQTAAVLKRFFERQRNAVVGGKGFDSDRWDRELSSDLWAEAVKTATYFGEDAASRIGGTYDERRTHNYLLRNAEIAASGINGVTSAAITSANGDGPEKVFDVALASRVGQLALERVTFAMNWAATEAARQNART